MSSIKVISPNSSPHLNVASSRTSPVIRSWIETRAEPSFKM